MIKKRLGASEFKLLDGVRAFLPSAHIPAVTRAMVEIPYIAVNGVAAQQKVVTVGQCRQDEDILIGDGRIPLP